MKKNNSAKEKYKDLCKQESLSVFAQPWWLDTVCGRENWDILLVEKGGTIAASLPIFIRKLAGLRLVMNPTLTPYNGLWVKYPPSQKYVRQLGFEKKIYQALIDCCSERGIHYFRHSFPPSFTNWLPFYWRGYSAETRYTYLLKNLDDLDNVYRGFDSNLRKNIRKAGKSLTIHRNCAVDTLYDLTKKTFARQNLPVPYTRSFLRQLDDECSRHSCRSILCAADDRQNIHAGIYLVWDNCSAYYLLGGADPEFQIVKPPVYCSGKESSNCRVSVKRLDFEGCMIEPIEKAFRSFGGTQTPYFNIYRKGLLNVAWNILNSNRKLAFLLNKAVV